MKSVVTLCCAMAFAVYAQSVLIHDGFEVSYDGWVADGDYAQITAHPGAGYDKSRGMKISNRHTQYEGALSQKGFYLEGGKEYDYSVYVKHEKLTTETYNLMLKWLYPDGETYGSQIIASAVVPSGKWTALTAKFTAPQGTTNLTLSITTNSKTDFFFDEVKVTGTQTKVLSKTLADVGLKDIYQGYFRIGSVLNSGTAGNAAIKELILKEFNSITAENEMKPEQTMTKTNSTNEDIKANIGSGAASILKFCSDNKIGVRGHTLVWHAQTPQWFFKTDLTDNGAWATKATMQKRLESYIKNIFALLKAQYPNLDLYAYDVVNEAVEQPNRPGCGRTPGWNDGKSPWVQIYNDNTFIDDAFTYARKYAPSTTKLYYNDFNEFASDKRDCIINNILKPLKQKGVLDGMGMQSHLGTNPNAWGSTASYVEALDKYVAAGVQVQITELDVSTEAGAYTLYQQAQRYKSIFNKAIEKRTTPYGSNNAGVTAVVVWGPNDAHSWVGTDDKTGNSNAPLLFDKDNKRKPAWDTVAALVPKSNWDVSSSSRVASSSSRAVSSSSIASSSSRAVSSSSRAVSSSSVASSSSRAVSSSSRAVSSSSVITGPLECGEYKASYCGGLAYGAVPSNSDVVPTTGECLYIGDFEQIQPYLDATIAVNGVEVTLGSTWDGADSTMFSADPINNHRPKPAKKDGGYYVYVKAGTINTYQDNGWRGIVAKAKPTCEELTPILNSQFSILNSNSPTYYTIKGEPLGNVKPTRAGIYIVKQGSSVQKITVR